MTKLLKIEKIIFGALIFFLFLQARIILRSFGSSFNEWNSSYIYITDILIVAVIFLWALRGLIKREPFVGKEFFGWLGVFLGIFLLTSAVSLAITSKFWLSLYGFLKLTELGLLFLYVKNNFSKFFNLDWFWRIFIASALVQSAVAIAQFFWQKSLGLKHIESPLSPSLAGVAKIVVNGQNHIRAYGLVPHPNILAAILISAIFGLAYLFIKNFSKVLKWRMAVYVGTLILISTALFFTFSRGVTLVGFSALLFWAAIIFLPRRQENYRRPTIIFVVTLSIVFCLLLIVFWPYVTARYDVQSLGQSQALNLRVFYNQVALDFIKNSPIFGIGQDNFVWSLSSLNLLPAWAYQPVHNIYLLIAAETGILGLLAFLIFLFFTLKSAWRSRSDLAISCLLFIVFCLLIIGLFDHFLWDLQQGQIIFWLFLGILASPFLGLRSSTDRT